MALSFPDLLDIFKVLYRDIPKHLTPIILIAWIQQRSDIPLDDLHQQYKAGKQELTNRLLALGYSGDTRRLHLNELWVLLAEVESNAN